MPKIIINNNIKPHFQFFLSCDDFCRIASDKKLQKHNCLTYLLTVSCRPNFSSWTESIALHSQCLLTGLCSAMEQQDAFDVKLCLPPERINVS